MTRSAEHPSWLARPGAGAPCTVIAEIAQAHDGSLGMAHAYIDAAAAAGADAVKFQTHIADAESTPAEPWRVKFSRQDETRFDYWRRMEFSEEQWHGLKTHADERGILFLSSPFSMQACELLGRVGVAGWKVASGEITNTPMLDWMAQTGQPVIVSTGMSGWDEIDQAAGIFSAASCDLAVLQCTTQYPSPPEAIGLNALAEIRERYGCASGLSDHSGTIYPSIAAATLGAQVLEVHITLSRQMFGPDVVASITPAELSSLVEGVRFVERMKAHPVDKATIDPALKANRKIFLKSVVATCDLPAGTVLQAGHLTAKKPGLGIPAAKLTSLIGKRLTRPVASNAFLQEDDLES